MTDSKKRVLRFIKFSNDERISYLEYMAPLSKSPEYTEFSFVLSKIYGDVKIPLDSLLEFLSEINLFDLAIPLEFKDNFIGDFNSHKLEEVTVDKTTYLFWSNKNITYYLYKVRAKNSPLYYIGIKSLNLPLGKVSKAYCSNDGYFGSGKTKEFSDFIEENKGSLYKEILAIETNRAKAYNKEKELLSDPYLLDKNCLNASAGGLDPKVFYSIEKCSVHGETKFIGRSCHKCSNSKNVSIKDCEKHGLVKHIGGACYFCRNEKMFTEEHCKKHGLVSHLKGACIRCKRSI